MPLSILSVCRGTGGARGGQRGGTGHGNGGGAFRHGNSQQHHSWPELWTTAQQEEHEAGSVVGLDVATGEALDPVLSGIYDNYLVKKQILQSSPVIASQLLLVDEVRGKSC